MSTRCYLDLVDMTDAAERTGGHVDATDLYLTDEAFLYRVAGLITRGTDAIVEIEDCYWLDVVEVPIGDFRARRLRVVTPSNVHA